MTIAPATECGANATIAGSRGSWKRRSRIDVVASKDTGVMTPVFLVRAVAVFAWNNYICENIGRLFCSGLPKPPIFDNSQTEQTVVLQPARTVFPLEL